MSRTVSEPTGGPIPYQAARQQVTDEDLAEWDTRTDEVGDVKRILGPCPRCGDETEHSVLLKIVEGVAATGEALPTLRKRLTQRCECACEQQHLGPANATAEHPGCGARWNAVIVLEAEEGEQKVRALPDDDPMLDAAIAADQLARGESPARSAAAASGSGESSVRAAGEKWLGAVTAIIGLFGLAGVVTGKDAFTDLPNTARFGAGVAALLALVAAVLAIFFSYRAAYGWPVLVSLGDDMEVSDWYRRYQSKLEKAPGRLKWGVICALIALGLLSVVAGCVWFWPRETSAPQVRVELMDESQVCGTLVSSTGRAQLRVRRPDGAVETVVASAIKSVVPASSCPA
ncbi:hypothetical protein ABZ705_21390 [Streptomyces sp. NPDC006984]|uniref:hypothetical protein n=1 Tax=Streptomyces sp. NPDC006984 TaxID=3155463 RepID=UPI0033F07B50